MSKLIANRFGGIAICLYKDRDPIFVYTFVDDNGHSDDCEYAFVFKGDEIRLYGWHFGHDITFSNKGNWMDNEIFPESFHDHDYQDVLVERLRLCLKEALNNITGMTTEHL